MAASLLVACTPRATPPPEPATPSASPSLALGMPLVFIVHVTRPPLDLPSRVAESLLDGGGLDWRLLGEPAGDARVLPDGASDRRQPRAGEQTVRAVERDRDTMGIVRADAVGPRVRTLTVDGVDPLLEPDAYRYKVHGAPAGPATTVLGVGDVMMGGAVDASLRARDDFGAPLRHVRRRLSEADITFGTLESSLSRSGSPRQPPGENFAADPRVLRGLRRAGFDLLSVGNNHVGDFGPRALVRTVRLLRNAGIEPLGAGATDAEARRPVIVDRHGIRFGFYAFNGRGETPRATSTRPGAVRLRMSPYDRFSRSDLARILTDVRALAGRVDVVIVLPHWGRQYTHEENSDQRRVARALLRAGADAVIGSHPHWVQGVDAREDGFVAYSLGNFIFSQRIFRPQTQQNVSVEMTFWGDELKRVELVPGRIEDDYAARFLDRRDGLHILRDVWRNSTPPFGRARG